METNKEEPMEQIDPQEFKLGYEQPPVKFSIRVECDNCHSVNQIRRTMEGDGDFIYWCEACGAQIQCDGGIPVITGIEALISEKRRVDQSWLNWLIIAWLVLITIITIIALFFPK